MKFKRLPALHGVYKEMMKMRGELKPERDTLKITVTQILLSGSNRWDHGNTL